MEQFDITIKNEKEKTYHLIILFFVALHALFFVFLLFDKKLWNKGIIGLVIIAFYSVYLLIVNKTSDRGFYYGSGFFLLFGLGYLGFTWLCTLDLVLAVLSQIALQKIIFHFKKESIQQKNFPYKKFNWDQFTNVILKDNILTLDFKNNKLFQKEIERAHSNEEKFNFFASQQLIKNS